MLLFDRATPWWCRPKSQNTVRRRARQCVRCTGTIDSKPIWRFLEASGPELPSYSRESAGGADFTGALKESNMACARAMVRLVLFSQIPKRRKGIAVAMTRSLALGGILASGSQRKSCADKKNVRIAQTANEQSASNTSELQGAALAKVASCSSVTR